MAQPASHDWGLGRLPPELRLRIWEATWPATRLIEVHLPPGGGGKMPRRITPSRQVGDEKITVWNSTLRRLEDVVCRPYTHPVALDVCREARNHTLQAYARLQHRQEPHCVFYFHPAHDVLWLHRDLSQFDTAALGRVQRVLFKDVERADDSDADKKQRRRELLEMVESMGSVREVMVLAHWTSIADIDGATSIENLYDWMQYFMSILDENWEIMDGHSWVLQFLSTWSELGVCFESGDAKIWGDAREGPLYSCPSHDVVYRKRLVERFPKQFEHISRMA
ncbi:hypothetical protein M406DRAFT_74593 [Cryphonectria parasitica EP155]|uniref:2EXR domain-containing protein n=1 Tax=Cryphonectria parasitica (strain ATCC 38755 / EP155) TaxID=660469 RepID=A0A9P5CKY2_CRYP1|nr:uncharacterized protein M406DRAFT_74593 [Cryphonectria parasitica EP155]KAF3761642.1 hypothetical protein M406DRAFT_74593 [Cryphonectria parasitica EP155]